MPCLIVDRLVSYDPDTGDPVGLKGKSVRAVPAAYPIYVDGILELRGVRREAVSDGDGEFTLALPKPSEDNLDPANTEYVITLWNGQRLTGEIPELDGPITLKDLHDDHGFTWDEDEVDPGLGYDQILDDGDPVTQRKRVNFGHGIMAEDDDATGRTNVYPGEWCVADGAIAAYKLTKVGEDGNPAQLGTSDEAYDVMGVSMTAASDGGEFRHFEGRGRVQVLTDGTAVTAGNPLRPSNSVGGSVMPLSMPGNYCAIAIGDAPATPTVIWAIFVGCCQR